jgi:hypothetical protein
MQLRIALVLAALSSLGVAAPQNQTDIAYVQNGVREIATDSDSGALMVFGEQAFPVVTGRARSGGAEPLIAAARLGKGRMVVIGNTDCLEQDVLQAGDTARMLANLLRWAGGEKSTPKIGIDRIPGLARRLKAVSSAAELAARDIQLSERNQVDVLVILGRTVTAADVVPLQEFVREGGGLVTGGRYYMLERAFPGKDLAEIPVSRLTAPAGISWARSVVQPTSGRGFRVEPPAELSQARWALDAFEGAEAGQRILTAREQTQVSTTLLRAILDLPADAEPLFARLDRTLAPFARSAVPSAAIPITQDDVPWRLAIAWATRQLRSAAPENVRAHPAAAEFPGSVPAGAPRVAATVRVETAQGRWGWFGTGLYAAPGEAITIEAPRGAVNQGLGIEIGAHTDPLWELEEWSRMPEVATWKPIASTETRVASAFGGAIYIAVPQGGKLGDFDVSISNGVPAPRFIDGQTKLEEWRSSIRNLPAPWAEIESDKIALSVPSRLVRDLDDPAALMSVWNRISDLISEFYTIPPARSRAERLVPDVQISGGIQHSGYPVMMYLSKAQTLLSRDELLKGRVGYALHNRAMWGLPHELGHQAHNVSWSFEGAEEPTANLVALYVMEKLCHVPVAQSLFASKQYRAEQMARYNFAKPDFEQWKADRWIGTTFYVQLQQAFGWEAFQGVFAEYRKLPASQQPKSDAEKRDQQMVRLSRQVHRNLGPFFQAWGIPTSQAARASVADLPVWLPEELPVANRGAAGR